MCLSRTILACSHLTLHSYVDKTSPDKNSAIDKELWGNWKHCTIRKYSTQNYSNLYSNYLSPELTPLTHQHRRKIHQPPQQQRCDQTRRRRIPSKLFVLWEPQIFQRRRPFCLRFLMLKHQVGMQSSHWTIRCDTDERWWHQSIIVAQRNFIITTDNNKEQDTLLPRVIINREGVELVFVSVLVVCFA